MIQSSNRHAPMLALMSASGNFRPRPNEYVAHAELVNYSRLQFLAMYYRRPIDPARSGGYDRLFTSIPKDCPPNLYDNQQRDLWMAHWQKMDDLPEAVRNHLCGPKTIHELGMVTDVPEEYLKSLD